MDIAAQVYTCQEHSFMIFAKYYFRNILIIPNYRGILRQLTDVSIKLYCPLRIEYKPHLNNWQVFTEIRDAPFVIHHSSIGIPDYYILPYGPIIITQYH